MSKMAQTVSSNPSYCNDGGARRVLEPKREGKNAATVHAQGVSGVPELARLIAGLRNSPPSISRWIVDHVKRLPNLKDTFRPANPDDVLADDAAWSFVLKMVN